MKRGKEEKNGAVCLGKRNSLLHYALTYWRYHLSTRNFTNFYSILNQTTNFLLRLFFCIYNRKITFRFVYQIDEIILKNEDTFFHSKSNKPSATVYIIIKQKIYKKKIVSIRQSYVCVAYLGGSYLLGLWHIIPHTIFVSENLVKWVMPITSAEYKKIEQ